MTHRRDVTPTRLTPTLRTSHAERPKPAESASGRVAFDERGNAVWELRTADRGYVRDASTTLVRKLLVPAQVAIEATGIIRKTAAPVPKVLEVPTPKRAVPADTGLPHDRAQMGTVRTFPVRSSTSSKRAASKTTKPLARPGLLGRLFGRK